MEFIILFSLLEAIPTEIYLGFAIFLLSLSIVLFLDEDSRDDAKNVFITATVILLFLSKTIKQIFFGA